MTASRVAEALFSRMHLVIADYETDMKRKPKAIVLGPRIYRIWRRSAALLYEKDGRDMPESREPDTFCGVTVRCSEMVACMMAA